MIYQLVGRRGVGKSTLALHLARQSAGRVIVDPRGLYRGTPHRAETADQVSEQFDRLIAGEIHEFAITADDDPRVLFRSTATQLRSWVRAHHARPASLAVIVDEMRDADAEYAPFDWVLRCSPRDRMHFIFTCHRPVDIPTRARAIADHWCIFRTTQTHDLDNIKDRCSADASDAVAALQGRAFVHWDDEYGTMRVVTDERSWFTSLDAGSPALGGGSLAELPARPIRGSGSGSLQF